MELALALGLDPLPELTELLGLSELLPELDELLLLELELEELLLELDEWLVELEELEELLLDPLLDVPVNGPSASRDSERSSGLMLPDGFIIPFGAFDGRLGTLFRIVKQNVWICGRTIAQLTRLHGGASLRWIPR